MPLAAAHIIPAIIIFNRLKDKPFFKQYLKPNALAIAAIGSLLPDIDILIEWVVKPLGYNFSHGTYTHTLLFAFLFFLPAVAMFAVKKHKLGFAQVSIRAFWESDSEASESDSQFLQIFKFLSGKLSAYLLLIAGGIILHILLDYIIGGGGGNGIMWFYPSSEQTYKIHLLSKIPIENAFEGLDAIILLIWIYFKSPILYQNK